MSAERMLGELEEFDVDTWQVVTRKSTKYVDLVNMNTTHFFSSKEIYTIY